ncbi:MAG: phosphohistidine phosphatase SixA [Vicinamibacterales bacterium]
MAGVALYLIRHAIAEERGPRWPDDARRPVSDAGARRMRRCAEGLAELGVTFDQILTSPLVRARQTAEIVAAAFEPAPPVAVVASLAPDTAPAAVFADLERYARRRRVALVGHEPGIGELAARLLGMRRAVEFKKGAVCRIDVAALPPTQPGSLRWFATPAILRALAR